MLLLVDRRIRIRTNNNGSRSGRPKDFGSSGSGKLLTTRLLQRVIPLYLPTAERQVANKEDQERAYQELADSLSEEDRRFLQQNARKRKWKVGVMFLGMIALPST
jgi:hypothetical protein